MKILIIGSAGQLGQDIVKVLKENQEEYFAATRQDADIADFGQVRNLLENKKPEAVINCAAFHDVGKCEENPEIAMEINALAIANLAKNCRELNAKFMTMSTDYVFDGTKVDGYTEEDIPNPIMWYGKSKLAGELLALANNKKTFVVRTQSLYGIAGPRGKGLHFVDLMIKLSKERDKLNVDQCRMAPTWTYPLAKNIYALMKTEKYGLYHMSCNGAVTWYEFARKIMQLINSRTQVIPVDNDFFPKNFKRPENSYLINRRLGEIGLDLMPRWEEALKEYLRLKGYKTEE